MGTREVMIQSRLSSRRPLGATEAKPMKMKLQRSTPRTHIIDMVYANVGSGGNVVCEVLEQYIDDRLTSLVADDVLMKECYLRGKDPLEMGTNV